MAAHAAREVAGRIGWEDFFPPMRAYFSKIYRVLPKGHVLDDEIVCLDEAGKPQFYKLVRQRNNAVLFYAFDCLYLDWKDLRSRPIIERKRPLERKRLLEP